MTRDLRFFLKKSRGVLVDQSTTHLARYCQNRPCLLSGCSDEKSKHETVKLWRFPSRKVKGEARTSGLEDVFRLNILDPIFLSNIFQMGLVFFSWHERNQV